MGKEYPPKTEIEQEVEEFIKKNYPSKKSWVNQNLETFQSFRKRKVESDDEIISDAINTTIYFAKGSGINLPNNRDTDVLHIPSRLAAIQKFEKSLHSLERRLSLDRVVKVLVIAESTSVYKCLDWPSTDEVQHHLDNLTKLVELHKKIS